MGVKLKLELKSYEKPEKLELPYKLKYKIYEMSDAEWKKLQELTANLKSFLEGLSKKQNVKLLEKYKKRMEEKIKLRKEEKGKGEEKSEK